MRLTPPTAATAIPRADECIATTPVQINNAPKTMRATRSLGPLLRLNIIVSLAKASAPCIAICKESEFRRMDSRARLFFAEVGVAEFRPGSMRDKQVLSRHIFGHEREPRDWVGTGMTTAAC